MKLKLIAKVSTLCSEPEKPLWPSAIRSRLVCLNVAPGLIRRCYSF